VAQVGTAFIDIEPKLSHGFGSDVERQVTTQTAGIGNSIQKSIMPAIGAIGAAIGAAFSAKVVFNFARDAISAMSDLNESTSKAMVVFGASFEQVDRFAAGAAESVLLSSQAALEAAGTFGNLFTAMGFSQAAAADLSPEVVQLGADLASFNNIGVEDALAKLRAGLVGEVEPLRVLGVSLNAAMVKAKAFELGLVDANGVVSESAKVQARWQLILEATTNAQGDVARTADGVANMQRRLIAEFENLQAAVGEKLLPVFADLLEQAPQIVDFFGSLVGGLDATAASAEGAGTGVATWTSKVALGFGQAGDVVGGFGDILSGVMGAFDDLAQFTHGDFDFSEVGDQLEDLAERDLNSFVRIASQTVTDALGEGLEGIEAFSEGIAVLVERTDDLSSVEDAFGRLAKVAGLTEEEIVAATKALLKQASALELNASDISFLELQMAMLNEQMDTGGRGNADYAASMKAITSNAQELAAVVATPDLDLAGFFEEANVMADELGISIGELVFGTDNLGASLTATLDPGEQLAARLNIIADDAEIAASVLATGLAGSIESVKSAFVDANEDMTVSADEFFAALLESQAVEIAFHENVLKIATVAPALASLLEAEGAEVSGHVAAGFGANLDLAAQAEIVVTQQTPEVGALIERLVGEAVELAETDPAALELFLAFAASLGIPGLTDSITAALNTTLTSAIDAIDFQGIGDRAGEGLVNGIATFLASNPVTVQLAGAASTMMGSAFKIQSPSKLMEKFGVYAGQGFVQGMAGELESAGIDSFLQQSMTTSRGAAAAIDSDAVETTSASPIPPTQVIFALDATGKDVLFQASLDWANRHIRQVSRAGG